MQRGGHGQANSWYGITTESGARCRAASKRAIDMPASIWDFLGYLIMACCICIPPAGKYKLIISASSRCDVSEMVPDVLKAESGVDIPRCWRPLKSMSEVERHIDSRLV